MVASSGLVSAELQADGVQVLWLLAPPGNLFGPALCTALMAALQNVLADPATRAVILASGLRAAGQGFSGGIDLADLGRAWPAGTQTPGGIARAILSAPCPVIAALHGPALGAGAEIALAAQGRVASTDLRFGLRDVLVGRLPMAGATQTLPRLIGAADALRLLAKGGTVSAAEAVALGIVDRVTEGDLIAAAHAMALSPPMAGRSPGLRDGKGYQLAIAQARSAAANTEVSDMAMTELLDCVEAAQLLPLAQGLDFEAEAAERVAARPEAAALQHLMTAEMRMVVDMTGGKPAGRIGLWGAATMGLILPALRAGLTVLVADDDRTALVQAIEKVALAQEEQVAAGRMTAAARDLEWGRLQPVLAAGDLGDCGLVIAAKPGAPGAVLHYGASGGSGAARVVLVAPGFAELQLPPGAVGFGQTAAASLRKMGLRLAVTQTPPEGGVARAIVLAAQQACKALMLMGVSRDSLAAALQGAIRIPVPAAPEAAAAAVSLPAPDLPASDLPASDLPASDLRARVLGAVATEGARLLASGAIRRAGVFDVLAVTALGMPRSAGGPLFAADQRGLMVVRRDLRMWQQDDAVWTPPALLDDLVSRGAPLSGVDTDRMP